MEHEILDDAQSTDQQDAKWAGFWIRVGASLIDVLVYLPFIGLNFYNLYSLKNLPLQLFVDIVFLLYKPLMEYKYGATLGKMAVKIKVVSENFDKITLSQTILRNYPHWLNQILSIFTAFFLFQNPDFQEADSMAAISQVQREIISPFVSSSISFVAIISWIVVAFTSKKQGLHDMIAKTYCIYK
ncbi:MAG: RDD family protein [Bacteroidia bacterium]|nr:RDD family protein [Bacteroidia bacterium]